MKKKGSKAHHFKFTRKKHSKLGIIALIVAICSIISCFFMLFYSYQSKGNASIYIGSTGMLAMLFGVTSFILAIKSLYEKEKFKLYPLIATFVSIIASGMWITIYILGFIVA